MARRPVDHAVLSAQIEDGHRFRRPFRAAMNEERLALRTNELIEARYERDVGSRVEQRHLLLESRGQRHVARVMPRDVLAARGGATVDQCAGEAAILFVPDDTGAGISDLDRLCRTVIDDDQLEVAEGLTENRV